MSGERNSLYIDSHGSNEESIKKGFAWIYHLLEDDSANKDAVLALNTKKNIKEIIGPILGDDAVKALDQDNMVVIDDMRIHLMTKRIDPGSGRGGPVLAVYADAKLLDKIDDMHNVSDVLVIPPSREKAESWISTWGATEFGSSNSDETRPEHISNPVVREAVDTLDIIVNSSTGVTHPSDRSTAIEVFKTLSQGNVSYDPEEIRAYLVAEKNWKTHHADDVKEIAEGVQAGKQLRYESGHISADSLERWRERAANTEE